VVNDVASCSYLALSGGQLPSTLAPSNMQMIKKV